MWDYVAFFGYNFVFFLFALLVWYAFPKPVPYDYTTIPGLKSDPNSVQNGNINEMRASGSLREFLEQLHEDYGPLASFYWGGRYVVAAGSVKLWRDVVTWSGKIAAELDIVPIRNERETISQSNNELQQNEHLVTNEANGGSQFAGSPTSTRGKDGADDFAKVITKFEQSLVEMEYDEISNLNSRENGENGDVRLALVERASRRCVRVFADGLPLNGTDGRTLEGLQDSRVSFLDLPHESTLRSTMLETVRLAIPFEYIFYTFQGEIDLDGHPIPAGVPLVICIGRLCTQAKDAESFMPDRFLRKSNVALGECLEKLPYFRDLASSMTSFLRRKLDLVDASTSNRS